MSLRDECLKAGLSTEALNEFIAFCTNSFAYRRNLNKKRDPRTNRKRKLETVDEEPLPSIPFPVSSTGEYRVRRARLQSVDESIDHLVF